MFVQTSQFDQITVEFSVFYFGGSWNAEVWCHQVCPSLWPLFPENWILLLMSSLTPQLTWSVATVPTWECCHFLLNVVLERPGSGPRLLVSSPHSATYELCLPGQVTERLCASVISKVKWGNVVALSQGKWLKTMPGDCLLCAVAVVTPIAIITLSHCPHCHHPHTWTQHFLEVLCSFVI